MWFILMRHTWNDGPPPFIGWWLTTMRGGTINGWRWWNGKNWSIGIDSQVSAEFAGLLAEKPTDIDQKLILWNWFWPENARVSREKQ